MMDSRFDTLPLPDQVFNILRDLIHERTGQFYDPARQGLLADKVSPRVLDCGFESFLDYYYFLKYDPAGADEWLRLADALSVQETYFWREFDQIRALVEVIVPAYAAACPGVPLRIWSAACASGEEPLTIAMALQEAGCWEHLPIQIVGSDISPAALARARAGIYRERSFRVLPAALRARYFTPVAGGWQIDPALHRRVRWEVANLAQPETVAGLATAGVIFCRNVLIYFSDAAIRRLAHLLATHIASPGYLFVGASESLLQATSEFTLSEVGGSFVYQRV
jgi:chemotaxis protein methyltransferase CheR